MRANREQQRLQRAQQQTQRSQLQADRAQRQQRDAARTTRAQPVQRVTTPRPNVLTTAQTQAIRSRLRQA
jgi:hypothetical protein